MADTNKGDMKASRLEIAALDVVARTDQFDDTTVVLVEATA